MPEPVFHLSQEKTKERLYHPINYDLDHNFIKLRLSIGGTRVIHDVLWHSFSVSILYHLPHFYSVIHNQFWLTIVANLCDL